MSRIGDVVIELQSQGVLIPETHGDEEPDISKYQHVMMQNTEYVKEMDKLTLAIIKDIGGE
jgi:hypothetical protein